MTFQGQSYFNHLTLLFHLYNLICTYHLIRIATKYIKYYGN